MSKDEIVKQLNSKKQSLSERVADSLEFATLYRVTNIITPTDHEQWTQFKLLVDEFPDSLPLPEARFKAHQQQIRSFLNSVKKKYNLKSRNYFFLRFVIIGFFVSLVVSYFTGGGSLLQIGCVSVFALVGFYLDAKENKAGRSI